jgi:predicted methyltransferase
MTSKQILSAIALVLFTAASGSAAAGLADGFEDAMNSAGRSAEDKVRDAARRPGEALEFVGIGAGMTVLDVAASSGWYTEVLSAAVGPDGQVIAHNPERRRERTEAAITAKAERLGNVTPLFAETGSLGLDGEVDAALTALNLHDYQNRGSEAAQLFLSDIFKALKPGGVFAVIDHEGSAGQDNKSLHRVELAVAKAALEEAGFEIDRVSEVLDNPADDHTLNIRDESLQRNTDRFLIRARKPE